MRIVYWATSSLQPEIEAVSKEVFQLAGHFPRSLLFAISPHYLFRGSLKGRYLGFHSSFDPGLRLIIPLIERHFDLSHVYGEPTPWTFYKSLHRKPIVLTVASEKGIPRVDFLARCQKVLVQTRSSYENLRRLGVGADKLELMYPGVDLGVYKPTAIRRSIGAPRVLFATAPRTAEELEKRGVYLLLKAAEAEPRVHYRLLFREWGNGYTSLAATKSWIQSRVLPNVNLTNGVVMDMPGIYRNFDFTVIPYTSVDGGKECPMSALEGLACGLPALVSASAPFAEFVAENKCGAVFDPTPEKLVAAIEIAVERYRELSNHAVNVAHRYFSSARLLERMSQIYSGILS